MKITRRYEIDMGHCLPGHEGKCYRPHGHRYVVEATVEGAVQTTGPAEGMVTDFATLRDAMARVLDVYDHRFVMDALDPRLDDMVDVFTDDDPDRAGVLSIDGPPTAETLAQLWGEAIGDMIGTPLATIRVYETPNCWADWSAWEGELLTGEFIDDGDTIG